MATTEIPWHAEKIFRLRGIFRSKPPICVSAAFLRTNPRWIFYKMFGSDSQLSEPPNEYYTYPDGQTRKVYPLDIPDAGLDIIFGLMWQYGHSYATDFELIVETYNRAEELTRCMSLKAWIKLLRYYGFMDPAMIIPGLEPEQSPQMFHLKDCIDKLVNGVLINHPEWDPFEKGEIANITYQFAFNNNLNDARSDGITLCLIFSSGRRMIPVLSVLTLGIDNTRHKEYIKKYLLQALMGIEKKFGACEIYMESILRESKAKRIVTHWPLTRVLQPMNKEHDTNQFTPEPRPRGTQLEQSYSLLTLTLEWMAQETKLITYPF